jgi:hypothetical protein
MQGTPECANLPGKGDTLIDADLAPGLAVAFVSDLLHRSTRASHSARGGLDPRCVLRMNRNGPLPAADPLDRVSVVRRTIPVQPTGVI